MACSLGHDAGQVGCVSQSEVLGFSPFHSMQRQGHQATELATVAPQPPVQAATLACWQPQLIVYVAIPVGSVLGPFDGYVSGEALPSMGNTQTGPKHGLDPIVLHPPSQASSRRQSRSGAPKAMQLARQQQKHQRFRPDGCRLQMSASDAGFVAALEAQLGTDGESRDAALAALKRPGLVRRLAFEHAGCRVVQMAFDVADRRTAAELVAGLQGCITDAIVSPHANYVIQKAITTLTTHDLHFVIGEIAEASIELARHQYGCRVFCRLLEHVAEDERTIQVIDRVLFDAESLMIHPFGHFVVECALEHGRPHQRRQIIAVLRKSIMPNSQHRFASYVLEKALLYGCRDDQQAMVSDIVASSPDDFAALSIKPFGRMVLRALLRLPEPMAEPVQQRLRTGPFKVCKRP